MTTTAHSDIRTRAAAGARVMDDVFPGWHDKIDLDRLDMSRTDACVLGQVDAGYWHAVDAVKDHPSADAHDVDGNDAFAFGFNLSMEEDKPVRWLRLDHAWTDEIERRREA